MSGSAGALRPDKVGDELGIGQVENPLEAGEIGGIERR